MTLVREGNLQCSHQWIYDDVVTCSYPPTCYRICSICGRVGLGGGRNFDSRQFGEIYAKFWSKPKEEK